MASYIKSQLFNISLIARRGGIEVLLPLISSSLKRPNQSYIIYAPKGVQPDVYRGTDITREYGGKGKLAAFWKFYFFCRKHKRDILHVYNIGPFFLLVARLANVRKLVYSIHGTIYWNDNFERIFRKFIWVRAISKRYRFTANSGYSRDIFTSLVSRKVDPIILYNPINSASFFIPAQPLKEAGSLVIVYTGRLVHGKNLFIWLTAAKEISDKFPNAMFKVYGEGSLKQELIAYALELGISEKVSFEGFSSDISKAYQNADLLLFLSEYESFGNVVAESILCGTPVIASDIPSMREIFRNYQEFLVPLDENLNANIIQKIEVLNVLKSKALQAAQEFRIKFSLERHIKTIESIYESLDS